MEEWKEYKLGEIASMKYGKLVPKNILSEGSIPIYSGYRYVGYTDKSNCSKDTIIVVARGVGGTGDVKITKEDCFLTNLSIAVNLDKDICIPYYFYYKYLLNNLKYLDSGSAQSQITIDDLKRLIVKLPNIETQCRIVKKVRVIDDKIEVNRRINEQLEELAGALFKSWFVDFDPFKDGEFVESELGMIPKGWKVGTLSDIGEVVGGATPSKSKSEYYTDNGISWITPKDLSINKDKFISKGEIDITELGYSKCSAKMMPRGSVLFSSRAPIGYIAIAKNELCTNQGFKSVVPQLAGTAFIYYYLKNNVSNIESMASGSTFKEASGALMKSLNVIVPPSNILQDFEEKVCSVFDKQESLEQEIHHLTTLRDTLLPKLMSGEIDVNEVGI